MSQERTEQRRDFAKDREIIAAATPGAWEREERLVFAPEKFGDRHIADCRIYNHPTDEANAIYITESRAGWPEALDEIDRLNAVITELTAKVQERDKEAEMLSARIKWLLAQRDETKAVMMAQISLRDKEIERLRTALEAARQNVSHIFNASDDASYIEKYALVTIGLIDSATAGAE